MGSSVFDLGLGTRADTLESDVPVFSSPLGELSQGAESGAGESMARGGPASRPSDGRRVATDARGAEAPFYNAFAQAASDSQAPEGAFAAPYGDATGGNAHGFGSVQDARVSAMDTPDGTTAAFSAGVGGVHVKIMVAATALALVVLVVLASLATMRKDRADPVPLSARNSVGRDDGVPAPAAGTATVSSSDALGTGAASQPIEFRVTPPEALLIVDGNEVAADVRAVPRPGVGHTRAVVARMKGFADATTMVDYFTSSPVVLTLRELASQTDASVPVEPDAAAKKNPAKSPNAPPPRSPTVRSTPALPPNPF